MIQYLYLILCILGTVLPCSQFLPFLAEHGPNGSLLIKDLFANRISGFFGFDVIVSSVVLWVLVLTEGRRQQMRHLGYISYAISWSAFRLGYLYSCI